MEHTKGQKLRHMYVSQVMDVMDLKRNLSHIW
jgi:hypothetical protein